MFQLPKVLNIFPKKLFSHITFRKINFQHVLYKKNNFSDSDEDIIDYIDDSDKDYQQLAEQCFGAPSDHRCFIVHPYVKWGSRKEKETSPEKQMKEAEALIKTLAPWRVHDKIIVSLESLEKKTLFGSGNLEKLKKKIRGDKNITAVFINVCNLQNVQIDELGRLFQVPIYDRYRIVMQILRLHAISKHAKLQVALAEVSYMKLRFLNQDSNSAVSSNLETRKLMLQTREQKIKNAIKKLRSQRELLRNRRIQEEFPVVAVVGYTNCGKTTLIKSLTGAKALQPKDQFFATLDVTVHEGKLPTCMKVLYVDTVGFISNIPTSLIECFVATLEDAMFADLILHVEDASSEDYIYQRTHVLETLKNLASETGMSEKLQQMITVSNKIDLVDADKRDSYMMPVSAETGLGLSKLLIKIEEALIIYTGRSCIAFRLPIGGDEIRWLYKNATVASVEEVDNDVELQKVNVIITQSKLHQFINQYLRKKSVSP